MSKGVLIFAFNSTFDYVAAATFAAKQAKKYLNLPITLVTNVAVDIPVFDNVILIEDNSHSVRPYRANDGSIIPIKWFNESRIRAYELSPYDQTLLIDADYFMYNPSLSVMFDTNTEFACFDEINDVAGVYGPVIRLSDTSIPMLWATVIYFTKSDLSKLIFDFMLRIKDNWDFYAKIYKFSSGNFRNDFALSIAVQALTGYSTLNYNRLPGKLHSVFSESEILEVRKTDEIIVRTQQGKIKLLNTNIHIMDKLSLLKFYEPT